jgi:hypothetical protein
MKTVLHQLLIAVLALGFSGTAMAADHIDSPTVAADAAGDINDLFAWLNDDGSKLNLVLSVGGLDGLTEFSDSTQYVFHVSNDSEAHKIMCTFAADQTISCWGAGQYVTGDASAEAGLENADGSMKVFAGQRNDPFFMSDGVFDLFEAVRGAAGGLTFNADGCPTLDQPTADSLLNIVATSPLQPAGAPTDDANADLFAGNNILGIVVQLDASLLTAGGNNLRVWATTNR